MEARESFLKLLSICNNTQSYLFKSDWILYIPAYNRWVCQIMNIYIIQVVQYCIFRPARRVFQQQEIDIMNTQACF